MWINAIHGCLLFPTNLHYTCMSVSEQKISGRNGVCLLIHTTGNRSNEAIKHDVQEQQCLLAGVLLEVHTQRVCCSHPGLCCEKMWFHCKSLQAKQSGEIIQPFHTAVLAAPVNGFPHENSVTASITNALLCNSSVKWVCLSCTLLFPCSELRHAHISTHVPDLT